MALVMTLSEPLVESELGVETRTAAARVAIEVLGR